MSKKGVIRGVVKYRKSNLCPANVVAVVLLHSKFYILLLLLHTLICTTRAGACGRHSNKTIAPFRRTYVKRVGEECEEEEEDLVADVRFNCLADQHMKSL